MSDGPHCREHLKKEKSTFYPPDLIRPRFLEFYPRSAMFRSLATHRPSLQRWFLKNSGILRNNVSRRAPCVAPLDTPAPHNYFVLWIRPASHPQQNVRIHQTRNNPHLIVFLINPFAGNRLREGRNLVRKLRQRIQPRAYFRRTPHSPVFRTFAVHLLSQQLLNVCFNSHSARLRACGYLIRDFERHFHSNNLTRFAISQHASTARPTVQVIPPACNNSGCLNPPPHKRTLFLYAAPMNKPKLPLKRRLLRLFAWLAGIAFAFFLYGELLGPQTTFYIMAHY